MRGNVPYLKSILLGNLLLLLSACGFHLRGMMALPPSFQNVYISAPAHGKDLQLALDEQLQSYVVRRSESQKECAFQIIIDDIQFDRQISNISSSTTPRQFQLSYKVKYHFIDGKGAILIPNGIVHTQRLVSMNSERLLGSNYEQNFFLHEMENDAARQIMTTISNYFSLER